MERDEGIKKKKPTWRRGLAHTPPPVPFSNGRTEYDFYCEEKLFREDTRNRYAQGEEIREPEEGEEDDWKLVA